MSSLFSKIHNIKNDRLLFISMHLSYAFLLLHFLCRNAEHVRMPIEIRIIALLIYTPFVVFGGRKGATFWTVLYACLMSYFTGIHNYAPFILLVIVTKNSLHKHKVVSFVLYILIFIFNSYKESDILEMGIHLIKCLLLFFLIFIAFEENKKKTSELALTPDEDKILKYLSQGYCIKEVPIFSANTICKKLKEARQRNGIKDNQELLMEYRKSAYYNGE